MIQSRSESSILARDRAHPRSHARLHRQHLRPRRPDREHVPARVQDARDRGRVPQAVVRVPRHLRQPRHRSRAARRALPQGARDQGREARSSSRRGVRYDLAVRSPEWIRELAQHHTGGYLKIAPEHTEDGPLEHMMKPGIGALRSLQGAVRSLLGGGGQGAVPDPVLHRRAPRHHRRGHAEPRAVAQAQRLPPRSGAGVPAVADGERDRDVPHRLQPAALAQGEAARARREERSSSAGSTRRSCATTIRRTGRCCARRCSAWVARI